MIPQLYLCSEPLEHNIDNCIDMYQLMWRVNHYHRRSGSQWVTMNITDTGLISTTPLEVIMIDLQTFYCHLNTSLFIYFNNIDKDQNDSRSSAEDCPSDGIHKDWSSTKSLIPVKCLTEVPVLCIIYMAHPDIFETIKFFKIQHLEFNQVPEQCWEVYIL